jgi:predicted nucleic-acid-binding protein
VRDNARDDIQKNAARLFVHDAAARNFLAECVYVLESFYELERERVAMLMRAAIGHPTIETVDDPSLLQALEVYETARIDFAEAYLVAQAEATGVGEIASFDRPRHHGHRREP